MTRLPGFVQAHGDCPRTAVMCVLTVFYGSDYSSAPSKKFLSLEKVISGQLPDISLNLRKLFVLPVDADRCAKRGTPLVGTIGLTHDPICGGYGVSNFRYREALVDLPHFEQSSSKRSKTLSFPSFELSSRSVWPPPLSQQYEPRTFRRKKRSSYSNQ